MLQSILEERFKLRVEKQSKRLNVYHLVIARGGLKIQPDAEQNPPPPPEKFPVSLNNLQPGSSRTKPGFIETRGVSIPTLLKTLLLQMSDRPIIDKTGLTALYSFKLQWSPSDSFSAGPSSFGPETISTPDGISFFTAIQEQVGLRLVPMEDSVEVLTIIAAQRPSEN